MEEYTIFLQFYMCLEYANIKSKISRTNRSLDKTVLQLLVDRILSTHLPRLLLVHHQIGSEVVS